jgi:hypothetical protein
MVGKPAMIAWGSRLDLFYQAPDMRIYQMHWANGESWHSDPHPVTDVSVLGFSVVSWGPGRFDVFARIDVAVCGTDNAV